MDLTIICRCDDRKRIMKAVTEQINQIAESEYKHVLELETDIYRT